MVFYHDLVMVSGIDQVLVNWSSWLLVDQLGPNGLQIGQYSNPNCDFVVVEKLAFQPHIFSSRATSSWPVQGNLREERQMLRFPSKYIATWTAQRFHFTAQHTHPSEPNSYLKTHKTWLTILERSLAVIVWTCFLTIFDET